MSRQRTFSDEIRQAILDCGMSRYEICKRLGLDQGAMSHFMHGRRGMTITTLDKLAAFLNLHIRKGK